MSSPHYLLYNIKSFFWHKIKRRGHIIIIDKYTIDITI